MQLLAIARAFVLLLKRNRIHVYKGTFPGLLRLKPYSTKTPDENVFKITVAAENVEQSIFLSFVVTLLEIKENFKDRE